MLSAHTNGFERILLHTIRILLAFVLVTPLIVNSDPFPETIYPWVVGKAVYFQILTEIAFGLWIVLAIRNSEYRVPKSWLPIIFGCYMAIAFVSAILGVNLQRSLWSTYERMYGLVALSHGFIYFLVLISVYRCRTEWINLLNFNVGVGLLISILGIAEKFGFGVVAHLEQSSRIDVTFGNPTYLGAYMLVNAIIGIGLLTRSLVIFMEQDGDQGLSPRRRRNKNRSNTKTRLFPDFWRSVFWIGLVSSATFLVFTIRSSSLFIVLVLSIVSFGFSYMIWPKPKDGWWRIFWLFAVLFALVMIYLSGTRAAFFGLAIGLMAFAILYAILGKNKFIRRGSLILIGLVLFSTLMLLFVRSSGIVTSSDDLLTRVVLTGVSDDSLSGRINSGLIGIKGFVEKPILGWGPENFSTAYNKYVTPSIATESKIQFDRAHNKLIGELVTTGVLGFVSYVAIWVFIFYTIVNRARRQDSIDQILTLFVGAGLTGYFAQNLFSFDTHGTVIQFLLLAGFASYVDVNSDVDNRSYFSKINGSMGKILSPIQKFSINLYEVYRRFANLLIIQLLGLVVAAVIVSAMIYYFNYKPYLGAKIMLSTQSSNIALAERLNTFDRTIESFLPLASFPRFIMFQSLTINLDRLDKNGVRLALKSANRHGRVGLVSDPDEWRIYVQLARLYQKASLRDPANTECPKVLIAVSQETGNPISILDMHESTTPLGNVYTKCSRWLIDRAEDLAPNILDVQKVLVRQYMIEGNYEAAYNAIDTYLNKAPRAKHEFDSLRTEIDKISGR